MAEVLSRTVDHDGMTRYIVERVAPSHGVTSRDAIAALMVDYGCSCVEYAHELLTAYYERSRA